MNDRAVEFHELWISFDTQYHFRQVDGQTDSQNYYNNTSCVDAQ